MAEFLPFHWVHVGFISAKQAFAFLRNNLWASYHVLSLQLLLLLGIEPSYSGVWVVQSAAYMLESQVVVFAAAAGSGDGGGGVFFLALIF